MSAKTVDEGNDLLYIYRDSKYREEDIFYVRRNLFHLKKIGKIIQRIIGEELDYDSSEGQNCNWEDYEWLAHTKPSRIVVMKKIITCQNLSHREKIILSSTTILLSILFAGNLAKSHEKSCIKFS